MKINWFSPIPPARTEIALHTKRVLPALAARAEVILWTDQDKWDPALEKYAKVRHYNPDSLKAADPIWREINRADTTFYNLGNNPEFHVPLWEASRQSPGIVVLHDVRLQHFFAYIYIYMLKDRIGYLHQMQRFYGWEGRAAGERLWNGQASPEQLLGRFPLTPFGVENSIGVFVHTVPAAELVRREKLGPVAFAPLPYAAHSWPGKRRHSCKKAGLRRLIAFGHIGPNRRLESVLTALSTFPKKQRFRLDVYGQVWDPAYVTQRISALGLSKQVFLHGYVTDRILNAALEETDLALNLRYPSVGEASASQLRIWDHALPTLVTPVEWYGGLPESVVSFVRHEHETADLHKHLNDFLAEPEKFRQMGLNGRHMLEEEHTVERYAQTVIEFARKVSPMHVRAASLKLAERAGREMGIWMDLQHSAFSMARISKELNLIFG